MLGTVLAFMAERGFDPDCGRKLLAELRAAGFEDVRAEGRLRVSEGGGPGIAFGRLSLLSLAPVLVEEGRLSQEDVDAALAAMDDPEATYLTATLVAAWGRRPGPSRQRGPH